MRIPAATICIVAALSGLAPAGARAQGVTRDAAACATLTSLQIPGLALSITKAEWIPAGSHTAGAAHGAAAVRQAAGLLPSRRRARSAHGRRRQELRHRVRAGLARRLERTLPLSGRRRAERHGRAARSAPWPPPARRRSRAASRWRAPTAGTRGRCSTPASWPSSRRASTSPTRPWAASPSWPSRSSRGITPGPPTSRTSPAARPAAARR